MSRESKGILWSAIDHFSVQGVSFILSIIIARLISPSAYGIVVMVQVFLSFAQLFIESGFKDALIQKTDRNDLDFYTVFNFNFFVALLLYGIMFISAPYIAIFYKEPILTPLTRVISLNLIFSSLSITQLVRLQINLDFKTLAKARLLSTIISGVIGVICAYNNMEVWALVIQSVTSTLLTSILLMVISRWTPQLKFSNGSFKRLFSFGSKLLFTNFITLSYIQLTNLFIGKVYSSSDLAYYNRGFNISLLIPNSFQTILNRIAFPIFCDFHNDNNRLKLEYRKYMRINVITIFPLMIILFILSKHIITILLTEKWIETASFLSIFCIVFLFQPILETNRLLILSVGRADITAKVAVFTRIMTFVLLFATINISPLAVALGLVLNNFIESIISLYCVKIATNISVKEQLKNIGNIVVMTILSGSVTYIISSVLNNVYSSLLIGLIAGFAISLLCVFIFKMDERYIIYNLIKRIEK